jgi:SAM-dependent methyltransferase
VTRQSAKAARYLHTLVHANANRRTQLMSVFNALYADQYDGLYSDKSYATECDLIEAAIVRFGNKRPRSVLDLGCGTGGHSIVLAGRGYEITGVDLSIHMLEHARAKANSLPASQRPKWLCGDVRTFDAGQQFDAAIMMFAVVGYLTGNEDVLSGLRNIRRQLASGALFVCDFWYGPSVLSVRPTDRVRVIEAPDGQVIRSTSTTLNTMTHTADVSIRVWTIGGGKLTTDTTESHRLRYFFPQEFALLLSQCGFTLQGMSAFPTLDEPLTDQTWNAFVVARAE